MSDQITYDNKVDLQVATNIANINKVTASDMNEIKSVVNGNATATETELTRLETDKLNIADVLNQASTDTDKPYSADYLNDKLVSVGTEAPTGGESVWFAKSKNLFTSNALPDGTTIGITKTFDNSEIKLSGTSTSGAELLLQTSLDITLPAGTYTMSYIKKSGSVTLSPGKDIALYLRKLGATTNLVTHTIREINGSTRSTTFTLTEATTLSYYMYCNNSGIVLNDFAIQVQIEEGSSATTYEPYIEKSIKVDNEDFISMSNLVSVGVNQPTDGRRVWFKNSRNLIKPLMATATLNGVTCTNNGDGSFTLNGTATATATFRIDQSTYTLHDNLKNYNGTYTLSCNELENGLGLGVMQYSTWVLALVMTNSNTPVTATIDKDNCFIYISIANGKSLNNLTIRPMLQKGSVATGFEPYVNPSINVDEEEWYNPNNIEKYSTKEIKIGTWIDGKPLYRKVVDIGTLPNATTKHVAHNISNIGSVVTLRGIVTDYRFFPVPFPATSNAYSISIFADTTNIEVMVGIDRSNMTGFVIIEYTKTTD